MIKRISLLLLSLSLSGALPARADQAAAAVLSVRASAAEISAARIFDEPLLALGAEPSPEETADLARALTAFLARSEHDDFSALAAYLAARPASPWNASLLCNLGQGYYRTGYFSLALEAWEQAWQLSKGFATLDGRAIADRALGDLVKMNARLGRYERLEELLGETFGRDIRGAATEKIAGGREAHFLMHEKPEISFLCGPVALSHIHRALRPGSPKPKALENFVSTMRGTSLWQVRSVAREIGIPYEAARRSPGASLPLPAVVHWKAGHYATVVGFEYGRYHIQDPTFGDDLWITPRALDTEASGYFLVPSAKLTAGWAPVARTEAEGVWGKGITASSDPGSVTSNDDKAGCPGNGKGMPVYNFHAQLVSLNLVDVPLGYEPPRGPQVDFRITYNQREAGQPAVFSHGNLGNKWTSDWITYLMDDPAVPSANVDLFAPGGGSEQNRGYNAATSSFAPNMVSRAQVVRVAASPVKYERRFPDGSKQVFDKVDGATSFPRRIFMTKLIDPQGQALTFAYDSQLRLVSVTDATGKVTALAYTLAADSRKLTRVTDPFGRAAVLEYNASRQLSKITDVAGMATTFTYGTGDFITAMTTPYGTSTFRTGMGLHTGSAEFRWLEAVDPLGGRERLEFRHSSPWLAANPTPPVGIINSMDLRNEANTLYWDKKAMAETPGQYPSARIWHWLRTGADLHTSSRIPLSTQQPLEGRVWYNYHLQNGSGVVSDAMLKAPTAVGRILDDGTTQLRQFEYNAIGNTTKAIDPLNRVTAYGYDAAGINVLTARQQTGTINELLATYTYNTQNRPLTFKDASGQTTTYTWNANGQLLTETNANSEKITYTYDATGFLLKVTGAQAADTTTFEYDTFGRVKKKRNPDGYILLYEYDALDRVTKITYPDNTYEQVTWNRLDPEWRRDRLGRMSRTVHNAVRQPVAYVDPAQRTTSLDWCACGSIKSLTDPNGNRTEWKRDALGRVTEKAYADGRTTRYAYENTTSRVKTTTDALGQVSTYAYFGDDNLKQVSYTNAVVATGTVSYAYETHYNRLKSMTDPTGVTNYAYKAIAATPTLGSGLLSSVDGPWSNDVIAFTYDKLGRLATRAINGSTSTYTYDNLGRAATEANPLGTFTYKYANPTDRLDSLYYPNGQKNKYSYLGATGDFRLSEIKNLTPALAQLSKNNYAYDVEGRIKSWTQQAGTATASIHELAYDEADQLLGDIVKSAATGNPVQKHFAYSYDKLGNRLTSQENAVVTTSTYNNVNQLIGQAGGGKLRFQGSVSEDATVTLDGQGVDVSSTRQFDGTATVRSGKDTVSVAAKDYANNTRTNKYEVNSTGTAKTLTYDFNGNLTGDGTRTYQWDAENRLVAIVNGALRSEFTYDGLWRRVRIVEKNGATVTSDRRFLWVGSEIAEERDGTGATVQKRYFSQGVMAGTTKYFYTRDHLGSIRELTDNAGAVVARYEYDPWGTRVRTAGTLDADFGFTGHYHHSQSGLVLAQYRAYNPIAGRWISRDPIGEGDGINVYAYVRGNTINAFDPDGRLLILVGPLAGALGEAVSQAVSNGMDPCKAWSDFDWAGIGIAAVMGVGGGGASSWGKAAVSIGRAVANGAAKGATKGSKNKNRGNGNGPDYVVTSDGTAIPVPDGASGPTPTEKPGVMYTGGKGGKGMDPKVDGVRIMEPNSNQGKRAVYMNESGQTVDPGNGRTVPNNHPNSHHYF